MTEENKPKDERKMTYDQWEKRWMEVNGVISDRKEPITKEQFIALKKKELAEQKKKKFRDVLKSITNAFGEAGRSGFQDIGQRAQGMQGFSDKEEE